MKLKNKKALLTGQTSAKYKEIYLDAPNVGGLEKEYLNKAIDTGYVSTIGPFVSEFEEKFAKYLGVKKTVSVQSGTAALLIMYKYFYFHPKRLFRYLFMLFNRYKTMHVLKSFFEFIKLTFSSKKTKDL